MGMPQGGARSLRRTVAVRLRSTAEQLLLAKPSRVRHYSPLLRSVLNKVQAAAAAARALVRLCDLAPGEALLVAEVRGGDALAARLVASGFWPGARVTCQGRGPFGDPLRCSMHGFRLALRNNEAERVVGERCQELP